MPFATSPVAVQFGALLGSAVVAILLYLERMARQVNFTHAFVLLLISAFLLVEFSEAFGSRILSAVGRKQRRHGKHSGFTLQECGGACDYRCSNTQYRKACMTYCKMCCNECRCVPPGTYGHKEVCPCYNNWKTKEGGPKCP